MWDTAGQEALINLRQSAYPGTQVLLIGFDMTKGVSLEDLPCWLEEVTDCEPNVGAIIVVGTKSDFYEELKAGGKGSDGQPLKTLEEMYAMAAQIGAHGFVCTSAKTGYGTLEAAEEGPAVDADPDTMSGQGEQYLDQLIMDFAKTIKAGDSIAVLESRAAQPVEPVVEDKNKNTCFGGGKVRLLKINQELVRSTHSKFTIYLIQKYNPKEEYSSTAVN